MATCQMCNAPSPRLYTVPAKSLRGRRIDGSACYFCYIRTTGIKPTRSKLVSESSATDASSIRT
jgi:hypothetical protein